MRIAQILLPGASYFDRKSFQIDQTTLAERHELVDAAVAEVAHLYGPVRTPPPFAIPYVAANRPSRRRFSWRKPVEPAAIISPLDNVREAVSEVYWGAKLRSSSSDALLIGTFGRQRAGVATIIDLTLARIHRFRDDIEWRIFDQPPGPDDLSVVDAWIDPATRDDDFDGFTAEALVAGKPVIASRTPLNIWRLDKGMSGFLVPPGDPNELTHAILTALFKSEVALTKIEGAWQTSGKFRPRQRVRALEKIYEAAIA